MRLMLEVRNGSATAFEELVVRYQVRLVRDLERLVGRRELAEDLAQGCFSACIALVNNTSRAQIRHLAVHDSQQRGVRRHPATIPPPGSDARGQRERTLRRAAAGPAWRKPAAAQCRPADRQGEGRDIVRMADGIAQRTAADGRAVEQV